jgi:hypothetical protein
MKHLDCKPLLVAMGSGVAASRAPEAENAVEWIFAADRAARPLLRETDGFRVRREAPLRWTRHLSAD